jgi:MraZ protein
MTNRSTRCGWMVLGGLICLFSLVLASKLRDGNRASAEQKLPSPAPQPAANREPPRAEVPSAAAPLPEEPPLPGGLPLPPLAAGAKQAAAPPAASKGKPVPPPPVPPAARPDTAASPREKPPALLPMLGELPPRKPAASPPLNEIIPAGHVDTPPAEKKPSTDVAPLELASPPSRPAAATPPVSRNAPSPPPPPPETRPMPGEPPLAPPPGPVQNYVTHGGETMQDIARRTLGGPERWTDIHKLNPTLKPDTAFAAGTMIRLPGEACVQADDAEVRPLPVMHPKAGPPRAKVVLPLTGTYPANLDDARTMTLPPAIREQLGGTETVLISPGPDQCLWLTNSAHLDRLAQRLEQSSARELDVRVFKRLYFAQTEKAPLSPEGRVTISERLAQFAGLHQEVVLVGIDDHFELWDAGRWRQYTQQKSAAGRLGGSEHDSP